MRSLLIPESRPGKYPVPVASASHAATLLLRPRIDVLVLTAERIDALMPARPEWVAVAAAVDSREFAVAAFRAHFTDGLPMSEPANVDRALSLGVFGVPTVVVGDRLFWGDDRLEEAASAVGAPEHQAE